MPNCTDTNASFPATEKPPPFSSTDLWTDDEDERLRVELLALVLKFEGRSAPAVMSRIEHLKVRRYHKNWPVGGERSKLSDRRTAQ